MNLIIDHKKAMYNGAILEPEQIEYNSMPEPPNEKRLEFVTEYAKSKGEEIINEDVHDGDICYYCDDKRLKKPPMRVEIVSLVNYKGESDGVRWKEINSKCKASGWDTRNNRFFKIKNNITQ